MHAFRILSPLALALAAFAPTPRAQSDAASPGATPVPAVDGLAAALAIEQHFASLAAEAYKQVVTVTGYRRLPPSLLRLPVEPQIDTDEWEGRTEENVYPGFEKIGIGSGFMVSVEGEVLTCLQPLKQADGTFADLIDVETPDRQNTICRLVAAEPTLNLALLRFEVVNESFPPQYSVARFGDSAVARAGQYAIGVGDPFGPEKVFTVGTITQPPDRDCYQENLTATYLQASMRVQPQCYGGPLLNIRGEVIGILMPLLPKPGIPELEPARGLEFALPSNILQGLYKSLREVQTWKSPWLGFAVMSRAELRRERGVGAFDMMVKPRFGIFIENVFRPSPASTAEIQPGDFLVSFDGQTVDTPLMFQRFLYLAGIGAEVELEIFRNGATSTRRLKIEERPANATQR